MTGRGILSGLGVCAWVLWTPFATAQGPDPSGTNEAAEPTESVLVDAVEVPEPLPSRPVAELRADLDSRWPSVRLGAALQLARTGTVGAAGLQVLLSALAGEDERVREEAAWALGSLQGPERDGLEIAMYDTPPALLRQTKPAYPVGAFTRKVYGTIVVKFLVGSNGQVVRSRVLKSIPAFDAAGLACVRQWRFTPAQREGRPVPAVALAPLRWGLLN